MGRADTELRLEHGGRRDGVMPCGKGIKGHLVLPRLRSPNAATLAGEQPLLRLSAGLWRLQLARARVLRGVRRAERGVGAAGAPASPAVSSSGDTEARGPAGGIARGPFSLLELDSTSTSTGRFLGG